MANVDDETLSQDQLDAIFSMQSDLNDFVFKSNNLRDAMGAPLTMNAITRDALAGQLGVNDLPNQWLCRYAQAAGDELRELQNDLRWKWWSKDSIDIQNIRVELVDLLHFLVSAMLAAGLSAKDVFSLYRQKHAVNLARQRGGYDLTTKSENDNRSIQ